MYNETLLEKFIRVAVDSVQARALLKEIVRVYGSPAHGAEAAAEREAALLRLCQLAQDELSAPPVFVKMPRRRGWIAGLVERFRRHATPSRRPPG